MQEGFGLGAEEGGPGGLCAPGGGFDAVFLEDLPDGGGGDFDAEGGEFPVDPPVAPLGEMLSSTFPALCGAGDYVEPGG